MIAGSEVTLRFSRHDKAGWNAEVSILSGKADHARIKSFQTHAATREEAERKALDEAGHLLGNNAGAVEPTPDPPDQDSPSTVITDG